MHRHLRLLALVALGGVALAAEPDQVPPQQPTAPQAQAPAPNQQPQQAVVAPPAQSSAQFPSRPGMMPQMPPQPGLFRKQVVTTRMLHATSTGYNPDDLADLQADLLTGAIVVGVVQHPAGAVAFLAKPASTLDDIAAIVPPVGASDEAQKRLAAVRDRLAGEERQRIESWSTAQQQQAPSAMPAQQAQQAHSGPGPAPPPASLGPNPTQEEVQKARAERARQAQDAAIRDNPQWNLKPSTAPQTK